MRMGSVGDQGEESKDLGDSLVVTGSELENGKLKMISQWVLEPATETSGLQGRDGFSV